jgi:transcriptional regulator with XRE-family HTH domain
MIGERLQALRKSFGKTRKEVAIDLRIHESTYGKYELGRREPDSDMLMRLADYFQTTVDNLLGLAAPPFTSDESEMWELRREMAERAEMKTLFSLAKTAKKEHLKLANEMLLQFKRESGYGEFDE